jgi:hypothetical protein
VNLRVDSVTLLAPSMASIICLRLRRVPDRAWSPILDACMSAQRPARLTDATSSRATTAGRIHLAATCRPAAPSVATGPASHGGDYARSVAGDEIPGEATACGEPHPAAAAASDGVPGESRGIAVNLTPSASVARTNDQERGVASGPVGRRPPRRVRDRGDHRHAPRRDRGPPAGGPWNSLIGGRA